MLAKPQGFPRKLGGCAGLDPRLRSAVSAGVGDGERGLRRGLRAPGVGVRPKWVLEYSPSNKRIRYFVSITYVRTGLWTAHKFCGGGNYFGFGLPAPVPYCLECSPHLSTLVFEDVLRPGYFLEWDDFPYPTSLRKNGRYFGRIWMTVAFAPARSARWGTEYCETHIEAHLGVYYNQTSRTTGNVSSKFRGLVPPEHRNPGILYESYQVEKLRKWAPVRTYYGDLGSKGERGERWRLMVKLLTRHGIDGEDTSKPQPFALILTIADPEQTVNVYDEMAQIVRNRFQAENLTLRATARVRARS